MRRFRVPCRCPGRREAQDGTEKGRSRKWKRIDKIWSISRSKVRVTGFILRSGSCMPRVSRCSSSGPRSSSSGRSPGTGTVWSVTGRMARSSVFVVLGVRRLSLYRAFRDQSRPAGTRIRRRDTAGFRPFFLQNRVAGDRPGRGRGVGSASEVLSRVRVL